MPNEIKNAERIMDSDPDSALHILQHMHTNSMMLSSSDRAFYGLLYFQALDKNKLTLQPDSLINYSLNYYQHSNDRSRLALCYFYKARIYKNAQEYDQATELYLKALDNNQDKKNFTMLGEIYADMGYICFLQDEYKDSREKYQLAADCFNRGGKFVDASYKLLDIGRTYYAEKKYKTAQQYFRKALLQTKDSILCGAAFQEIGVNYYYAKQYDSAQYYLRKSMQSPSTGFNYAIRCYTLADLYYNIEKFDSAYLYASVALKHPSNFYTRRECYRILANTEYLKGDFKQMAYFMTHFQSFTDSIRRIESQTKTTVLENVHNTSQAAGKTKQYLLLLGWILPIIILISFLLVYRLRYRNKGKEQELQQVEQKLSQNRSLLNEKQSLLKSGLIQKIEEAKSLQASVYKISTPAQREAIDKELYNNCLHINDWSKFSSLMNHTFNNLINFLENKYPDITHKEITWCCFFLLDIPTPKVLLLLDYKQDSLYKMKQRLVQKMNLKSAIEIDNMLKEITEGK